MGPSIRISGRTARYAAVLAAMVAAGAAGREAGGTGVDLGPAAAPVSSSREALALVSLPSNALSHERLLPLADEPEPPAAVSRIEASEAPAAVAVVPAAAPAVTPAVEPVLAQVEAAPSPPVAANALPPAEEAPPQREDDVPKSEEAPPKPVPARAMFALNRNAAPAVRMFALLRPESAAGASSEPIVPEFVPDSVVRARPARPGSIVLASEIGPAAAGAPGALTLAAVARQAVGWHPNIAAAMGRLNQSGEEIEVARAGYYPRVSTGLRAGRDGTLAESSVRRFNVTASQMLYDFGKVESSVAAARAASRVNQARVVQAVDQVALEAAQAAIELARYEELAAAAGEQIGGVSEIAELVRTRHERGASTRSDVMQAQSRVSASQSIALQYGSQLARWNGVLRTLLNVSSLPELALALTPESTAACRAQEPEWPEVAAVRVAEAEREQAQALLEAARANRYPTLLVDAGVGRALNNNATRREDFTLALNVSMDVYQGGAITARGTAAEYALRAADAARDNARLSAQRALTDAREQTRGLAQRMEVLDGRRRSISETKSLYRQQYLSLGTRSLIDLLNAEQEFHQSRFDQINTKYELMALGIDCLYAAGAMRRAFGLEEAARIAGNMYDDE